MRVFFYTKKYDGSCWVTKKVVVITRWPYYQGGLKAGFHCILPFSQRFFWQSLAKLYDPPMAGTACWIKDQSSVVSPFSVLILDKKLSWDLLWLAIIQSMGWSSEVVINNSWKCCKSKCTHNGCFPTSYEKFVKKKNSKEINTLANYVWNEWEIAIMNKDVWCFKQLSMLYLALTPFPTQFFFLLFWTNPG